MQNIETLKHFLKNNHMKHGVDKTMFLI